MKNLNVLYELFSHNHQESDGFKGLDIDSKLNNIFERIFTNPGLNYARILLIVTIADPEYLPHLLFLNLFGKYIIEHDAQYKQMETKLSAAILVVCFSTCNYVYSITLCLCSISDNRQTRKRSAIEVRQPREIPTR